MTYQNCNMLIMSRAPFEQSPADKVYYTDSEQ